MKNLLLVLLLSGVVSAQVYVKQDTVAGTHSGGWAIGTTTTFRQTATKVVITGDYVVKRISIFAYKVGNPTNKFKVRIRNNDAVNKDPGTTIIGEVADSIAASSLAPTTYAWFNIDVPAGIDISAYDTVWVCLSYDATKVDASNYINWGRRAGTGSTEGFAYGNTVWLNDTRPTFVRLYSQSTLINPATTQGFGRWAEGAKWLGW